MIGLSDLVKAVITAIVIMAVNVAISYGVVAVYAYVIEPGHEAAFYEAAAQKIAPWSSVVAGIFLFFGAAYFLARRKPVRSAVGFAFAFWLAYALIEFVILASEQALGSMMGIVSLSLVTKLIAAIAGANAAVRSGPA